MLAVLLASSGALVAVAAVAFAGLLLLGFVFRGPGHFSDEDKGPLVVQSDSTLAEVDGDVIVHALTAEGFVCHGLDDDGPNPVVVQCQRTPPGHEPSIYDDEVVTLYRWDHGIDGDVRPEVVPALRQTGQPLQFPPSDNGMVRVWAAERTGSEPAASTDVTGPAQSS